MKTPTGLSYVTGFNSGTIIPKSNGVHKGCNLETEKFIYGMYGLKCNEGKYINIGIIG